MGAMSIGQFVRWRANCEFHAARRCEQRGVPMPADDLAKLSSLIELARQAFEVPKVNRYWIGVRRGDGTRLRVMYDTNLCTIVTLWSRP